MSSGSDPSLKTEAAATSLDVAVCQLTSIDDVDANVQQILGLLSKLETHPPDFISFPENALFFRLREGEKIPSIALDDPRIEPLKAWALRFKSYIHLGSIPREENGRLFNSTVLIEPDGRVRDVYQKIHLFDVDVAGHKPVRESDVFAHGAKPAILDIKGWKIGCTICYDLRFPELFLQYALSGAEVILIPSAFLVPTGKAHWEILTRARAIESQAYVLAAAQGGKHENGAGNVRSTYGHSLIVDPWGEVLETLGDDFGAHRVLRATLTKERVESVRRQIPMKNHRRL